MSSFPTKFLTVSFTYNTKRLLTNTNTNCCIATYILIGLHDLSEHLQVHPLHVSLIVIALLNELQLGSQCSIFLLEIPRFFILKPAQFLCLFKFTILLIEAFLLLADQTTQLGEFGRLDLNHPQVIVHLSLFTL